MIPGKNQDDLSSDDEPVTKYIKIRSSENNIDLTEDVKKYIKTEVDRALKAVEEKKIKQKKILNDSKKDINDSPPNKIIKLENNQPKKMVQSTPELVFADVNECDQPDVKAETSTSIVLSVPGALLLLFL